jgi:hypothetical protein
VVHLEEEVGVGGGVSNLVDDHRRSYEVAHRNLGHIGFVPAGHPVDGRVDMRARVLTGGEVVPMPRRTALVVVADFLARESPGVP